MTTSSASSSSTAAIVATAAAVAATAILGLVSYRRYLQERDHAARTKYVEQELEKDALEQETIPSIIEQFSDFVLTPNTTISEANKRRTTNYYQKARDAHLYDLVPGIKSYPRLRNRRAAALQQTMRYYREGLKSHRTVLAMCDPYTAQLLQQARADILEPLAFSTDETTRGVWIPQENIIPLADLHVTVAIPWWWHTIRAGNEALTRELVARFRQALVVQFHHPFQIELERIVLLGGKALVALWRCIGERKVVTAEDGSSGSGFTIYDRHGETVDPFAALRRDIVRCFTTEDFGKEPLTYAHRHSNVQEATPVKAPPVEAEVSVAPPLPGRPGLGDRVNTIEIKTPGLGDHDGFIHTTLARLPLECLAMQDVELAPIHRLCREATAAYCGHRMVVDNFRFLETTGAGGESNPCVAPIFDESVAAPPRFEMNGYAAVTESNDLHASRMISSSSTIGAIPRVESRPTVDSLFEEPVDLN